MNVYWKDTYDWQANLLKKKYKNSIINTKRNLRKLGEMNLTVFLELVEFKAKTASVLPFFIGICFSLYNFHKLHLGLVLLYFIAMFIFNMAVDILDNYNDYHHATEIHDYREKTNIIGRENLDLTIVFRNNDHSNHHSENNC